MNQAHGDGIPRRRKNPNNSFKDKDAMEKKKQQALAKKASKQAATELFDGDSTDDYGGGNETKDNNNDNNKRLQQTFRIKCKNNRQIRKLEKDSEGHFVNVNNHDGLGFKNGTRKKADSRVGNKENFNDDQVSDVPFNNVRDEIRYFLLVIINQ